MGAYRRITCLLAMLNWLFVQAGDVRVYKHLELCNIQKVAFTQKGYIQFLHFEVNFPLVREFTMCLWVKSSNLTHNQPLFSYSMNGETRVIRSWLSPDHTIHMAIHEVSVIEIPFHIETNRWYHICQSWTSKRGDWQLYVDGKLRGVGEQWLLKNSMIPAGGDAWVGQEATDENKGLDDGVEGEVFGFNFVDRWIEHRTGQRLLHYGYEFCTFGRGSPVKTSLISWAYTPVRAFGGAIFSHANPVCGHF